MEDNNSNHNLNIDNNQNTNNNDSNHNHNKNQLQKSKSSKRNLIQFALPASNMTYDGRVVEVNKITTQFKDAELEAEYLNDKDIRHWPRVKNVAIMLPLMIALAIQQSVQNSNPRHATSLTIRSVVLIVAMFCINVLAFKKGLHKWTQHVVMACFFIMTVFILTCEVLTDYYGPSTGMVALLFNLFTHPMALFHWKLYYTITSVVMYVAAHLIGGQIYGRFDLECAALPSHVLDLVFTCVGGLLTAYQLELVFRKTFLKVSKPFFYPHRAHETEGTFEKERDFFLKLSYKGRFWFLDRALESKYRQNIKINNHRSLQFGAIFQFIGLLTGSSQDVLISVQGLTSVLSTKVEISVLTYDLILTRLAVMAPLVLLFIIPIVWSKSYKSYKLFALFLLGIVFALAFGYIAMLVQIPQFAEYRWIYFHFIMRSLIYITVLQLPFIISVIAFLSIFVAFNIACAAFKLTATLGIYDIYLIYAMGVSILYCVTQEIHLRLMYIADSYPDFFNDLDNPPTHIEKLSSQKAETKTLSLATSTSTLVNNDEPEVELNREISKNEVEIEMHSVVNIGEVPSGTE